MRQLWPRHGSLAENLFLHMDPRVRERVFSAKAKRGRQHGQARTNGSSSAQCSVGYYGAPKWPRSHDFVKHARGNGRHAPHSGPRASSCWATRTTIRWWHQRSTCQFPAKANSSPHEWYPRAARMRRPSPPSSASADPGTRARRFACSCCDGRGGPGTGLPARPLGSSRPRSPPGVLSGWSVSCSWPSATTVRVGARPVMSSAMRSRLIHSAVALGVVGTASAVYQVAAEARDRQFPPLLGGTQSVLVDGSCCLLTPDPQ